MTTDYEELGRGAVRSSQPPRPVLEGVKPGDYLATDRPATEADHADRRHYKAALDLTSYCDSPRKLMREHTLETLRAAYDLLVSGPTPNQDES